MPVLMMFLYGMRSPSIYRGPAHHRRPGSLDGKRADRPGHRCVDHVPRHWNGSCDAPEELFRKLHMKAIVRFSPHFAADLRRGSAGASVQVLIDGSDPNVGTILKNVFGPVVRKATLDALDITSPATVTVDEKVLYNQEQKSALFFVPGLMAIILLMISALLTSLAITREKELGTLEQLLVSPVRPARNHRRKDPSLPRPGGDGRRADSPCRLCSLRSSHRGKRRLPCRNKHRLHLHRPGDRAPRFNRRPEPAAGNDDRTSGHHAPYHRSLGIHISRLPACHGLSAASAQRCRPPTYLEIIRGIVLKGVGITVLWRPLCILAAMGLLLVMVSVKQFRERL